MAAKILNADSMLTVSINPDTSVTGGEGWLINPADGKDADTGSGNSTDPVAVLVTPIAAGVVVTGAATGEYVEAALPPVLVRVKAADTDETSISGYTVGQTVGAASGKFSKDTSSAYAARGVVVKAATGYVDVLIDGVVD